MAGWQVGFAERFLDPRLGQNARLEAIDALIDWAPLESLARGLRPGKVGRPPFPPLAMLKALLLAAMYDLSDPGLEAELNDRLSFRRFCGFPLDAPAPDETTLCRFRGDAGAVIAAAFAEVTRQLDGQGLILRKGTLMDATLVRAARRPPSVRTVGAGGTDAREPEATWTRQNGVSFWGYKAHVGADEGSLIVRKLVVTGAKTYESEVADHLICWDEAAVYGDKAYPQKARRAALRAAGIKDRIATRRSRHHPVLPHWVWQKNRLIARRRAPVEGIFSGLKNRYGRGRARSSRFATTVFDLFAAFIAHNLHRAVRLTAA
jgi:IS5 family transposase